MCRLPRQAEVASLLVLATYCTAVASQTSKLATLRQTDRRADLDKPTDERASATHSKKKLQLKKGGERSREQGTELRLLLLLLQ